eukprot:TRINITY_DN8311_c0_g3_i1.p1 TRINITY_DN8311_c0_g3~~TRINITY_DN8311_c0_g3_i1.p1  ORF type:complete len:258 (+),score=85.99 TRINITY_DN8311_c0_g3_i1:146-919(+)
MLWDFPSTREEFEALNRTRFALDVTYNIKMEVVSEREVNLELLEHKGNFEEELKSRLEEFVEDNHPSGPLDSVRKAEEITPDDLEFIAKHNEVAEELRKARHDSHLKSPLRNTVIKDFTFTYHPGNDTESLRLFIEALLEDLGIFSADIEKFHSWLKEKKVIPFTKPEVVAVEVPQLKLHEVVPEPEAGKKPGVAGQPSDTSRDVKLKQNEKKTGKEAPALAPLPVVEETPPDSCLLYTSDAADDLLCVDLGGRRII